MPTEVRPRRWHRVRSLVSRESARVEPARAALGLITLASALLWLCGAPFIQDLGLPRGPAFAVLLAACAPSLVRAALRAADAKQHVRALSLLIGLGIATQLALHALVPSGFDQSLLRITHGHGEFLRIAAARRGHFWQTLREYDSLWSDGTLGNFAGSKPPGTLAVYMLLDRVAQTDSVQWLLGPLLRHARALLDPRRIPESAALGVVLFPVLTFLAIAPLVWLGRSLYHDARAGYGAALLAFASPAILLIDLHLDGALFPLLALCAVALTAHATRVQRPLFALAGGVVAMLGVYCTFGLLPVVLLGLGVSVLPSIERACARSDLRATLRPLVHTLAFTVGAGLALLLLIALLKFQPSRRFSAALAFHTQWKSGLPTELWRWLSLAEFALYLAPPLAAALLFDAATALCSLRRRQHLIPSLLSLGTLTLLLTLALTEGTSEAARLFLFLVPFLALTVAGSLQTRCSETRNRQIVTTLCAAQAALAVLMKVSQPW